MKNRQPYFQFRGNQAMSQNRIIVPAKYNLHITISVDTVTGQSEFKCSQPIQEILLAGIFSQHATASLQRIIASNARQQTPSSGDIKPNGDLNNAT